MQVRSCFPTIRIHLPTSQTSSSGDTRAHCPTSRSAWCCCPTRLPRRACAACCSPPPRNTMQLPCWAPRYRACARGPRATPAPLARELLLVEILQLLRGVLGDSDPWLLAAELALVFAVLSLLRSEF